MGLRGLGVGMVVGVASVLVSLPAEAHVRDYVINEPYYTAKQGEFEVELRNDMNFSEAGNDETYHSKHQVELEYGLTDHFQLAYYEVYTWDREQDWARDAFKIEAKLRLAEAGQWPVDVALYTEYENPNGHRDVHSDVLENKVIMSRDFGPWNVIGNFIFEKPLNSGEPWAFEYTAGASFALSPRTRIGLELKETLGNSDEFGWHQKDHQLFLVPGIYASFTPHVRLLVGPAFGLTRASDDFQLNSIVEVEF